MQRLFLMLMLPACIDHPFLPASWSGGPPRPTPAFVTHTPSAAELPEVARTGDPRCGGMHYQGSDAEGFYEVGLVAAAEEQVLVSLDIGRRGDMGTSSLTRIEQVRPDGQVVWHAAPQDDSAILTPYRGGATWATEDEMVRLDGQGQVGARLAVAPEALGTTIAAAWPHGDGFAGVASFVRVQSALEFFVVGADGVITHRERLQDVSGMAGAMDIAHADDGRILVTSLTGPSHYERLRFLGVVERIERQRQAWFVYTPGVGVEQVFKGPREDESTLIGLPLMTRWLVGDAVLSWDGESLTQSALDGTTQAWRVARPAWGTELVPGLNGEMYFFGLDHEAPSDGLSVDEDDAAEADPKRTTATVSFAKVSTDGVLSAVQQIEVPAVSMEGLTGDEEPVALSAAITGDTLWFVLAGPRDAWLYARAPDGTVRCPSEGADDVDDARDDETAPVEGE